jgi:hypothetical protein
MVRASVGGWVGGWWQDSDAPPEFLCELCNHVLKHPVRTPYGNVYERDVIHAWFRKNGSIDPLTGQPLAPSELREEAELKERIRSVSTSACVSRLLG